MSVHSPRHCEPLALCGAKQSLLFLWRASVLASLLLLFSAKAYATTITQVEVLWRDSVSSSVCSQIESIANATRGAILSELRLNRLCETVLSQLGAQAHYHAAVSPRDFRVVNDSLTFAIEIEPGPRTRITKWELLGLARTDSAWLAAAMSLPVGDYATASAITDVLSRIASFPNLQFATAPEIVATEIDSLVIIHLHIRESTPARFEGAIAAGSSEGSDQSLLGRFSLGLNGLFHRAHTVDIQYEHPQPRERLLRLNYSENRTLTRWLSSRVEFEDWRRQDHRQSVGTSISVSPQSTCDMAFLLGVSWQKVAPLSSSSDAARRYESSVGMSWRRGDAVLATLSSTYSLHRQWAKSTGVENSQSRVRLDSEGRGRINLTARSNVRVSYGARWWGSADDLRTGDEWFLGGSILSGYADRSIAAADGAWTRLELSRSTRSGFAASCFGDLAWLSMFDNSYAHPATLGLAFLLESPGRSGRLELAWKDHASLGDGILRLSVIQGW